MKSVEIYNIRRRQMLTLDDALLNEVESIKLNVCTPEYGWMDARLVIGEDIFPICFSQTYSPFLNCIEWLEKIICGEMTDPVWFDDEHNEHFFCSREIGVEDKLLFEYIRFCFPGTGVHRQTLVNKVDLIREFYWVLKYLMLIDFEEDTAVYFDFSDDSYDIVKFDLSKIEAYLENAV